MKTCATIFTGGGGFEKGAVAAGLTPIWGVEHSPDIAGGYARNFGPHVIVSRAQDVDYSRLTPPWWLHSSNQCTNASSAKQEGKETEEDISQARSVARALSALRAPQFSLENVWNYRNFESFRIILRALQESGYAFDYWHLNAADYGVPQTRKRLILLASKAHRPRRPRQTHTEREPAQDGLFGGIHLPQWRGWFEAIEDLIPTLPESKFAKWQLERLPDFISESFYAVAQQSDDKKGTETGYGCPRRGPGEPALTVTTQSPAWFKAFILSNSKTEFDEPTLTVNTHTAGHVRAWLEQGRVVSMTPRALARFQSVPDDYWLPSSNGLACKVVGNMVPPLLAERFVASELARLETVAA